jgi:hypothetical protein
VLCHEWCRWLGAGRLRIDSTHGDSYRHPVSADTDIHQYTDAATAYGHTDPATTDGDTHTTDGDTHTTDRHPAATADGHAGATDGHAGSADGHAEARSANAHPVVV